MSDINNRSVIGERNVQDLSSFRLPQGFRGRPAWFVQLWWITQSVFFNTSPQALYGWRRFLLRLFGAKIGANVEIRPSARITYPWRLTIERDVWVGDHVELYTLGPIFIGEDAVVSQGSYLCTATHDHEKVDFRMITAPVRVEAQAWVAAQVFIGPGVTIGRGAVVGARSLVLKDVPAGMVAIGHPAVISGPRVGDGA